MTLKRAIALRISNLMIKNKVASQYILCKRAGLTESTLRAIINEEHKSLNVLTLFRICEGLSVSIQEFFDDDLFKSENLDLE